MLRPGCKNSIRRGILEPENIGALFPCECSCVLAPRSIGEASMVPAGGLLAVS